MTWPEHRAHRAAEVAKAAVNAAQPAISARALGEASAAMLAKADEAKSVNVKSSVIQFSRWLDARALRILREEQP
jgi:hypothetical protein